jgi:hypothetical protein
MDKEIQFIGKVTEKVFGNGGSIIRLSLGDKDKELLKAKGYTNIAIQKSKAGAWYAKIDDWAPSAPARPTETKSSNHRDDLPF